MPSSWNKDAYRHYLAALELDQEQENDILTFLYQLCDEFTDIATGKHATHQNKKAQRSTVTGDSPHNMVSSLCPSANMAFKTAIENLTTQEE